MTYILIPAINVSTRHAELASIARWAQADNLTLNIAKSREKLFSDKRRKEKFSAPAEIAELKRVCKLSKFLASLLNQWIFSITACSQCHAPKQYALHVLRAHGLCDSALQAVYRAVVVAKLTYASNAWIGFPQQTTVKRSQLLFDAANALASVQVNSTASVVYVTPLILDYLLRFYIILYPCHVLQALLTPPADHI